MIGRTPNTFIIGAGPVATALAGGLRLAGVPVLGLWARRAEPARIAGRSSGVAAFSSAPPDLLLEANCVIVAVSDAAVGTVAEMLVRTGLVGRSHVLVHCGGARSAGDAFAAVDGKVRGIATLHPLRAIADPVRVMRELGGTVFGVEGDTVGHRVASDIVSAIGGQSLALEDGRMAAYHAAAATASNFVVTLMEAAGSILESVGIAGDDARSAMVALAVGALENVAADGTAAALTGPIKRGDAETVRRHLEVVDAVSSGVSDAYRSLARLTLSHAEDAEDAENADPQRDKMEDSGTRDGRAEIAQLLAVSKSGVRAIPQQ